MKRGRGWEREGRDGIKGVGLRLKIKWVEVFGIWRYRVVKDLGEG